MSYTTTESDDGLHSSYYNESPPATDNGNDCRSKWEGNGLKKGPWSTAEDDILIDYVKKHGEGNWNAVQKHTGLYRCGKSCRLRWANHLRPNLKKGAFSQEEEQVIVELHAKMGNRWARMAAHLPGRTDNEIKNYWNTRIKRRQRAGLPLYPPEMHGEVVEWSQEYSKSRFLGEETSHQDFLQLGSCESSVFFDSLNFVTDLVPGSSSYLADIAARKIQGNDARSPQYENFMPPLIPSPKRLRESESLYSYGNNHSPVMIPNSHTFMDGIVPTSKPSFEALKLELPSFQYPEATFDQWKKSSSSHSDQNDTYIDSPPPPSMERTESDCFSNCNTGLLDMLLLEAKIRNNSTKKSLYKSCSSTTSLPDVSHIKSEECEESFKSLVHSEISISTQYNGVENPSSQREKERKPVLDMTRPDVLLASSWLDHGLGIVKETSSISDAFAVLLGDDDYMHISMGASSSVESCSWSNMPPVCQMTELP